MSLISQLNAPTHPASSLKCLFC